MRCLWSVPRAERYHQRICSSGLERLCRARSYTLPQVVIERAVDGRTPLIIADFSRLVQAR